jgi:endonuclease/exonuclease/phosphatase family metal-dependent hydrolase
MSVQTNQSGLYWLVASNLGGITESDPAFLDVRAAPVWDGDLKVLTWNVKGNNATNWSTQSPQVEAIRRVLTHLAPDVITFNEIPHSFTWEMTNWVAAFLPGWYLATNSGTDSFIRSVIASRFQILSSRKHFDGTTVAPYGTGAFTRDLFQARIRVPGFAEPFDVFTTHLKATTSSPQEDADKRAAEAMVISNFLANVYLPTNRGAPYVLTGDLNEDVLRPDTGRYISGQPIQQLVNPQTGLILTTPLNPVTLADLTVSIQSTLSVRFDYVLPCATLADSMVSAEVFRSDMLGAPEASLVLSNDSRTASDHLPVMIAFRAPNWPLRPLVVHGPVKLLSWESSPGEEYRVLSSTNLAAPLQEWTVETANLQASNFISSLTLTSDASAGFYKVELIPAGK